LAEVPHFVEFDKVVGHAFEVGVDADDDVYLVGVVELGAQVFTCSDHQFVGEGFAALGFFGEVFVLEL
jgi:hypothetical protein